jgi:serine protease DegQ
MKRLWLVFAQSVTVLLAAFFVVATLKPQWLDRRPNLPTVVPVLESARPNPLHRSAPAASVVQPVPHHRRW